MKKTRIAPVPRKDVKSRLPLGTRALLKNLAATFSKMRDDGPPMQTPWTAKLTEPLRVLAHTDVQFELFVRKHDIRREMVHRVTRIEDVICVRRTQPLILLEGYMACRNASEILAVWHHRGGTTLRVSDERALNHAPICEHDTDGDGNCDHCVHRGGCTWPKPPPILRK